MTLNEWIEENKDKEIEFKDGTILIKEKPKSYAWEPEEEGEFWYIDANGDCESDKWSYSSVWCNELLQIGNVFRDEWSAEQAVKRLKFWRRLQEIGVHPRTANKDGWGWMVVVGDYDIYSPFVTDTQEQRGRANLLLGKENIHRFFLGYNLSGWNEE